MAIKCFISYYPVTVSATKGGKEFPGATVKFESWALILGNKVGPKTTMRTTDSKGIAEICMGYRRYGKVSVRHPTENFGAGKGSWYTVSNISSLRSPKTFAAVVRLPALPPYVPPKEPVPPVIPTPVIPTPVIPVIPKPEPIIEEYISGLPSGRIGANVQLTMMNYFKDRPTFVGGAYWGCKGASRTSADIVHVAPNNDIIELKRDIDVGETQNFKNGFSVKVTRVYLSGRSTYANVIITKSPAYRPPTPVPPTPTPPVPPVVEKTYKRFTKILSDSQDLPKANKGETVRITAESYCTVDNKIDKSKVPSILIVDGMIADRKPVVEGVVSYEWTATAIPSRHTICVQINPTDTCRSIGKDCKKITVLPSELDPSEQLAKERRTAREQRELIRQTRTELREYIIGSIREIPKKAYEPPTPAPISPMIIPIVPPIEKPPTIKYGNIKLTGLPIAVPENTPIYVYVDAVNKGKVLSIPMTISSIQAGTHSVYIMAGEFKSIPKSVNVIENETTNISLL